MILPIGILVHATCSRLNRAHLAAGGLTMGVNRRTPYFVPDFQFQISMRFFYSLVNTGFLVKTIRQVFISISLRTDLQLPVAGLKEMLQPSHRQPPCGRRIVSFSFSFREQSFRLQRPELRVLRRLQE